MRFRTLHASVAMAALVGWAMASAKAADLDFAPLAQPDPMHYGIALGVGVDVLNMPSLPLGVYATGNGQFDRSTRTTVVGPSLSASIGGQVRDTPYSVELSGSYSWLDGDDNAVQTFTGPGAFMIRGPVGLKDGSIDLVTVRGDDGAAAGAAVTARSDAGFGAGATQTTFSPPGGASRLASFSPLPEGGTYTVIGANGTTPQAVAFAGTGTAHDFAFAGLGDLGGLQVRSHVDEDTDQGILEMRFGSAVALGNGWSVAPTIAPAYRRIERDISTTTLFDLAAGPTLVPEPASVRIDTDEDLTANYYGGNIGATVSGPISSAFLVNFGADVGVSRYNANYDVSARASIFNPNCTTCESFDTGRFEGPGDTDNGTAYLARVRAGIGYSSGALSVSLNGQAEYLSDVPTLRRDALGYATDGATTLQVATDGPVSASRLVSDDMWAYGATIGISYGF